MQSTRLQRCWKMIVPDILNRWNRLSAYDLAGFQGNMDQLVDLIRRRHTPARTPLSVEAEIRDWISERIARCEKIEESI